MRLKSRILMLFVVILNAVIWYKTWTFLSIDIARPNFRTPVEVQPQKLHMRLARLVTVVIRQFENFENDVTNTIKTILNSFPTISIIVVFNEFLYPPLELDFSNDTLRNVKLVYLQPSFNKTAEERDPLSYVHTKFVVFVPDATRLITKQTLQEAISLSDSLGIVSVPVGKSDLTCLDLNLKVKEWSLRISNKTSSLECDMVVGKHVTIMEVDLVKKLSDPFLLPFADAIYLQSSALGMKVHILKNLHFSEGKPLYRSQQAQYQLQQLHRSHERFAFDKFGIKKVVRATGNVEWYGCSREKPHCFGSVVNGIPAYLYQNRYTPPCCLAGLRKVALHVFDKLDEVGIRYWLESNSLLGAMLNGDLLPWDHMVMVGVNRDDLNRSPWIIKARNKAVVDNYGFVWEKATEGEFFKVQYSKVNRLHVAILPFFSKNGTMRRDSWFLKNKDFPEHFLHPMTNIDFAGRQVPSPNNIRDFLEMKFYRGVVENPELLIKLSPFE